MWHNNQWPGCFSHQVAPPLSPWECVGCEMLLEKCRETINEQRMNSRPSDEEKIARSASPMQPLACSQLGVFFLSFFLSPCVAVSILYVCMAITLLSYDTKVETESKWTEPRSRKVTCWWLIIVIAENSTRSRINRLYLFLYSFIKYAFSFPVIITSTQQG